MKKPGHALSQDVAARFPNISPTLVPFRAPCGFVTRHTLDHPYLATAIGRSIRVIVPFHRASSHFLPQSASIRTSPVKTNRCATLDRSQAGTTRATMTGVKMITMFGRRRPKLPAFPCSLGDVCRIAGVRSSNRGGSRGCRLDSLRL